MGFKSAKENNYLIENSNKTIANDNKHLFQSYCYIDLILQFGKIMIYEYSQYLSSYHPHD